MTISRIWEYEIDRPGSRCAQEAQQQQAGIGAGHFSRECLYDNVLLRSANVFISQIFINIVNAIKIKQSSNQYLFYFIISPRQVTSYE